MSPKAHVLHERKKESINCVDFGGVLRDSEASCGNLEFRVKWQGESVHDTS